MIEWCQYFNMYTDFSDPPPVYVIKWNQSQVEGWIDNMLTEKEYNKTLILEIMQPVSKVSTYTDTTACLDKAQSREQYSLGFVGNSFYVNK